MITLNYRGRLGNNLIQYAAAHVLAKKTNLRLDAPQVSCYRCSPRRDVKSSGSDMVINDLKKVFNIKPVVGDSYDHFIELTDRNYFEHLTNPVSGTGYRLNGFFHSGELLVRHRKQILELYKPPVMEPIYNDAFVACRLGDCLRNSRVYCTMQYLQQQLDAQRKLYDKVYITSETINHPPLVNLIKQYNLTPYQDQPLTTLLFASQFDNLILSAGSFSYWMAYLSKATNVTRFCGSAHDGLMVRNAWDYNPDAKRSSIGYGR